MYRKRLSATRTGGAVAAVLLGSLLGAAPQAAAAGATCATNVYKRTFYKNTSFSGTPVRTDCDSVIGQNWSGSPIAGMPSNNFGVRWQVTRDFGYGGPFTFAVSATDGVRVYLDGTRKIDLWANTGDTPRSKTVNLTIPLGRHTIRVDYVNWTGAAKVTSTYTPRTSAKYDKTKPGAPEGVSARYDQQTRQATLSWLARPEMDLAGYSLYRRPVGVYTWTKVATTTALHVTDPQPNPDDRTPYFYEVRAVDKAGNTSSGLDVLVRPLPIVQWITGSYEEVTGDVTLKWGQSYAPEFDYYTVLTYEKVDGRYTWVPLAKTRDSTWTTGSVPPDGETRIYRILVTNHNGTTTVSPDYPDQTASNELWFSIPDTIAPVYAPDLTVEPCEGGVQATVTEHPSTEPRDFVGYEIERREPGTSNVSMILHQGFSPSDPTRATMCEIRPSDGRTYEYRARTYDAAGNYSPYSETRTFTMPRA